MELYKYTAHELSKMYRNKEFVYYILGMILCSVIIILTFEF